MSRQGIDLSPQEQPVEQKNMAQALASLIVPERYESQTHSATERVVDQRQEAVLYQSVWGTAASSSVVNGVAQVSADASRRRNEHMNEETRLGVATDKKKKSGSNAVDEVWFQRLAAVLGEQAATEVKTKIENFAREAGSGLQVNANALQALSKELTKALGQDVITKLGVKPDAVENAIFDQLKRNDSLIKSLQSKEADPRDIIEKLNLEASQFTKTTLDVEAIRKVILQNRTGVPTSGMAPDLQSAGQIKIDTNSRLVALKQDIATFLGHHQTQALSPERRLMYFDRQLQQLTVDRGLSPRETEELRSEFQRLTAIKSKDHDPARSEQRKQIEVGQQQASSTLVSASELRISPEREEATSASTRPVTDIKTSPQISSETVASGHATPLPPATAPTEGRRLASTTTAELDESARLALKADAERKKAEAGKTSWFQSARSAVETAMSVVGMGYQGLKVVYGVGKAVVGSLVSAGTALVSNTNQFCSAVMRGDSAKAWSMLESLGSATLNLGGMVCSAVGLADMYSGFSNIGSDVWKVVTGQLSLSEFGVNLVNNLVQIKDGAWKGVKTIAEFTGVTDVLLTAYHAAQAIAALARGDSGAARAHFMSVCYHGAFATLSFGGLVLAAFTGGTSLIPNLLAMGGRRGAQIALLKGAKELCELSTKKIAGQAVKSMERQAVGLLSTEVKQGLVSKITAELGEKATTEAVEAILEKRALETTMKLHGRQVADIGGARLTKMLERESASVVLSKANVKNVMREVSEEQTKTLLEKLNLSGFVEDLTHDMLVDMSKGNVKRLSKEIAETFSVSEKSAKQMVKEMRTALIKGRSDDEMKKILGNRITNEVVASVEGSMAKGFKERFRRALTGKLDPTDAPWASKLATAARSEANRLGKSIDDFADELVESGWNGAREGLVNATRVAVEKGIARAFERFRARERFRSGAGAAGVAAARLKDDSDANVVEYDAVVVPEKDESRQQSGSDSLERRVREAPGPNGQRIRIVEARALETEPWQVVSSQEIISDDGQSKPNGSQASPDVPRNAA